jgi:hypothetical protein
MKQSSPYYRVLCFYLGLREFQLSFILCIFFISLILFKKNLDYETASFFYLYASIIIYGLFAARFWRSLKSDCARILPHYKKFHLKTLCTIGLILLGPIPILLLTNDFNYYRIIGGIGRVSVYPGLLILIIIIYRAFQKSRFLPNFLLRQRWIDFQIKKLSQKRPSNFLHRIAYWEHLIENGRFPWFYKAIWCGTVFFFIFSLYFFKKVSSHNTQEILSSYYYIGLVLVTLSSAPMQQIRLLGYFSAQVLDRRQFIAEIEIAVLLLALKTWLSITSLCCCFLLLVNPKAILLLIAPSLEALVLMAVFYIASLFFKSFKGPTLLFSFILGCIWIWFGPALTNQILILLILTFLTYIRWQRVNLD